jgi:prolyl oligopeptidase PreP (S9A serine peptidase family)
MFSRKSWGPIRNEEGTNGNSAGNLLNGGQFCELNGKIYFSNPNDEGALYVMDVEKDTFKKLSEDKVSYINAIGDHLYYVRSNYKKQNRSVIGNFNSTGIYRIDQKGKKIKMLYDNASGLLNVYGNNAYFQGADEEGNSALYSVSINGTDDKVILPEDIQPFTIFEKPVICDPT